MLETSLYDLLIDQPDLIEEGLTYVESQVRIGTYRCDLMFLDRNNKQLFVEVKLKVGDKAVGQLLRYDGLVNNPEARFMLVGLTFVHGLKEALTNHGYEHKEIIPYDKTSVAAPKINMPQLTKGEAKFNAPEELIASFRNDEIRIVTEDLYRFTTSIPDVYFYLSDGIMFKRTGRNYKFLSITTIGDRLLFHVPVNKRDEIFKSYLSQSKIFIPKDPRYKNQIDVKLKDIKHIDGVKELIQLAYELRE